MPMLPPQAFCNARSGVVPYKPQPSLEAIAEHAGRPPPSLGDMGPLTPPLSPESPAPCSRSGVRRDSLRRNRFLLEHTDSSRIKDVYEIETNVLGSGGFGTLRRARLRSDCNEPWNRVVKTLIPQCQDERQSMTNEIRMLKRLDHPNICRFFESFHEENSIHVVLELIDGRDLCDYMFGLFRSGYLDHGFACSVTQQILNGLHYCHWKDIVHRDIKPDNVMISDIPESTDGAVHVKLIDFGLARTKTTLTPTATGGTWEYMAPEVRSRSASASPGSDLWSVGITLHVLLCGYLPSEAVRSGEETFDQNLLSTYLIQIPAAAQDLLVGLLDMDPSKRCKTAHHEMTSDSSWTHSASEPVSNPVAADTIDSFANFHMSQMLKRAVVTAAALQITEGADACEIRAQFVAADRDGNGQLSKSEFLKAVSSRAPQAIQEDAAAWLDTVFDSIDTDASGEIEYSEFLAAATKECRFRSQAALSKAFRTFDVDQSGRISMKEFERVLNMMPKDVAACVAEFDMNADGEIDFEEFQGILAGNAQVSHV